MLRGRRDPYNRWVRTDRDEVAAVDEDRLTDFLHRVVNDLGATMAAGSIVLGDHLGLYHALAAAPLRPQELAERTGTAPRYIEEWLRGQAAGGYVDFDPTTGRFSLNDAQALALTNPDGPLFAPGAFQLALGALRAEPDLTVAFRTGEGVAWHRHDPDVFLGCERFLRPGYTANLVPRWLPALDGVDDKLHRGITVADVGCGYGTSTLLMAQAYPRSTFTGSDYHDDSIDEARVRAEQGGFDGRVRFEVATAQTFDGGPYHLITTFHALRDMGDPLRAARRIREQLADDGTWMVVEPAAGSTVSENLNPVGRVYYLLSAFLSVPNALSQEGGYSLGAQAGEEPVRRLAGDAGFTRFRRVARTLFHVVYEARP
jgi:2-polyprenyl-3-methyl-5-hydroxy-6-metoxy-1,4-benzoquinol methylase